MQTYNDICNWIENRIGPQSVRDAGAAIGSRVYDHLIAQGVVGLKPNPQQIMEGLKYAADVMIRDPKKRGWELHSVGAERLIMRRTQSFNCLLQEGLLGSLLK